MAGGGTKCTDLCSWDKNSLAFPVSWFVASEDCFTMKVICNYMTPNKINILRPSTMFWESGLLLGA